MICPHCHGNATIRTREASYFDEGDWVECATCDGTGEVDDPSERETWPGDEQPEVA